MNCSVQAVVLQVTGPFGAPAQPLGVLVVDIWPQEGLGIRYPHGSWSWHRGQGLNVPGVGPGF